MSAKLMPGLNLSARWDLGEDGWNVGMDENLLRLSAMASLTVPSIDAPLVEQASIQIAPITHAEAAKVATFVEGVWWFFQPSLGMRAHVRDRGRTYVYTGAGWVPASELPSYLVNPSVTGNYVVTEDEFQAGAVIVITSETDVTITISATVEGQISVGSNLIRRPVTVVQAGAGRVQVVGASGVVIGTADGHDKTRVQNSVCSIIPVTATSYVLAGDLAA